jgi:hypothetical protein
VTSDVDAAGAMLLVLLGAGLVAAGWAWTRAGSRVWTPVALVLLVLALGWAGAGDPVLDGGAARTVLVGLATSLAVAGGGPVTTLVFAVVDRGDRDDAAPGDDLEAAGALLRGGAWIGALERGAVAATLVAGWPEGLAVVLALKGLGRYPELRNAGTGAVAERFIIGTFTSVLWAATCAAVVVLAR